MFDRTCSHVQTRLRLRLLPVSCQGNTSGIVCSTLLRQCILPLHQTFHQNLVEGPVDNSRTSECSLTIKWQSWWIFELTFVYLHRLSQLKVIQISHHPSRTSCHSLIGWTTHKFNCGTFSKCLQYLASLHYQPSQSGTKLHTFFVLSIHSSSPCSS